MPIGNSYFEVDDRVEVVLQPSDSPYENWNGRVGRIVNTLGAGQYLVESLINPHARIELSTSQMKLTLPREPAAKAVPQFKYVITLQEHEYAKLMQLVMKYGTGTGEGISTPVDLRIALADAEVSRV
jgi:hypothetical protein